MPRVRSLAGAIFASVEDIDIIKLDIEAIADSILIRNGAIYSSIKETSQSLLVPYSRGWINQILRSLGTISGECASNPCQFVLREGWEDDLLQLAKIVAYIPHTRFSRNYEGRSCRALLYKSIFLYAMELRESGNHA